MMCLVLLKIVSDKREEERREGERIKVKQPDDIDP